MARRKVLKKRGRIRGNQFRVRAFWHVQRGVGELDPLTGKIGLEPILFCIAVSGEPQIVDHRIDVVFELGDFTARFDLNGARQIALGDAVATSAMARTCVVRLAASRLTLPVRSFHVPAAPGTLA